MPRLAAILFWWKGFSCERADCPETTPHDNVTLMKNKVATSRPRKTGQFVLTRDRGEKISAVEGLKLSPRMRAILRDSDAKGLSGDERRALILKQLRLKN